MRRILTVGAFASLVVGAGVVPASAGPFDPPVDSSAVAADPLPEGGTWVPYSPVVADGSGDASAQAAPALVEPVNLGCPAGTTNYAPPNDIYSCVAVYGDNGNKGDSGGGVYDTGMRAGRADPNGFGLLHASTDHNLSQRSIAYVIVNNATPRFREDGRYLYGLRYEYAGVGILSIEVIVQPTPDEDGLTPDGSDFGLITAYCVGTNVCPPEVNATFP